MELPTDDDGASVIGAASGFSAKRCFVRSARDNKAKAMKPKANFKGGKNNTFAAI